MIIDKNIEVKIAKYNIEHYKNYFDVKLGDIITIDTELHLQKESNKKINVQCDICKVQRYIKFQAYTKNKERSEKYPIYTCDKCSHIKLKETNKEKYGVEYYSKLDEHSERVKKTSIEKYGVEHYSKTSKYIERRDKTNMEKFGYINPFMDVEKIKNVFIDRYGVDNPSKVKEYRDSADISTRSTRENNGTWISLSEKTDWKLYKDKVRSLTRKNVKLLDWDGTDFYDGEYIKENFSLHHFDSNYPTIDHKISIFDGFINNKSIEEIASVDNLCWTKRIINITKNKKSHN
jgi:hypothetical protein